MFNISGIENIVKANLYEIIADRIEDMILSDPSMVGEKLPSEQAVADSFDVSRNVVRESFKILKERGFINVKNGEGSYVCKPQPQILTQFFNRMMKTEQADAADLYEIRFALDVNACALAAERISAENIKRLHDAINMMTLNFDNRELWSKYDLEFHMCIVKSTGNRLFYALYKPVAISLKQLFEKSWQLENAREEGLISHNKILNALETGNSPLAREAMVEHLNISRKDLLNALLLEDNNKND